jgi:hypothetical protein
MMRMGAVRLVGAARTKMGRGTRVVTAVVHTHAAKIVRPEGTRNIAVIIKVFFRIRAGGASVLSFPAVSAREDVLDTLVGKEFRGLTSPGSS